MEAKRQIIALGGGGFRHDPADLSFDRYVLDQVDVSWPSVCFLATASGDSENYLFNFYQSHAGLDCRPTHLSLFNPQTADLESFLLKQDIISVGGGNTRSMLALWREWDLDSILYKAWKAGVLLTGMSAGAICWFEQGVTDSVPGALSVLDCLGYLPGSCCPHYDSEAERKPAYREMTKTGAITPGYAVDDWAALHYVNRSLTEIITARPEAAAYHLSASSGVLEEIRLSPTIELDPAG